MGMGNSFGRLFRISTWGESHGGGVGVNVDGCPPKIPLSAEDIQVGVCIGHHGKYLDLWNLESTVSTRLCRQFRIIDRSDYCRGKRLGTVVHRSEANR